MKLKKMNVEHRTSNIEPLTPRILEPLSNNETDL